MLSLRLFSRSWASGELRLLGLSIFLAVMVVTVIAVFVDRLDRSLLQHSNSFIAADLRISSSKTLSPDWASQAQQQGLKATQLAEFSSMLFSDNSNQLASVKAVGAGYPLRGELEISNQPFAVNVKDIQTTTTDIPAPGTIWLESRLFPLLKVEIGSSVYVGEKELIVKQAIIREPDRGMGFSLFGARVLMNAEDLPATGVVQPGSRIRYDLLVAGSPEAVTTYSSWVKPLLSEHERLITLDESQQRLTNNLKTGQRFLLLSGLMGLVLAGIAIAVSAQQYARVQVDNVALLKCLGAGRWQVRRLYAVQLLVLASIFSLLGVVAGDVIVRVLAASISEIFDLVFVEANKTVYVLCFASGLLALLLFGLLPLWRIPSVSPIKILRPDISVAEMPFWIQGLVGGLGLFGYLYLFSGDSTLALLLLMALTLIALLFSALVSMGLLFSTKLRPRLSRGGYLALTQLLRYKRRTFIQLVVFSCVFMLLFLLVVVRTSLVKEWALQLPEKAPNHFLVNIAPNQLQSLKTVLAENHIETELLYPMVRARLTEVNDQRLTDMYGKTPERVNREVNLSAAATLASDNKVIAGSWWGDGASMDDNAVKGVSVEQETADELNLKLGDTLMFSVGGLSLNTRIQSIRTVEWDSMHPNFYFLLEPGGLDDFSQTYITSAYIPAAKKMVVRQLYERFPTALIIELDIVIERIKSLIEQLTYAVGLVLLLVCFGGFLVMVALINLSMSERQRESGLLRALGAPKRLVERVLWLEFLTTGLLSAITAAFVSELITLGLQRYVFDFPTQLHWQIWLLGVPMLALLVGWMGKYSCREVLKTPPSVVLREAT